jgi:nitroreductase
LSIDVPAAPEFGAPIGLQGPLPEMLGFMARRRSVSAQTLEGPGPKADELEAMLRLAARAPDHGKLFPWRFLVLDREAKASLIERLAPLAANQADPAKAQAVLVKLRRPPVTVAVISRPTPGKIREWEQVLSAGAVCMNLLLAAEAMGYGANWITDWYAYDPQALALLELAEGERIAGFVHIGNVTEPPLERARPDIKALTRRWTPKGVVEPA